MAMLRHVSTSRKLLACFALVLCLSTALSVWMLLQMGQLAAASPLTAKAGQKLSSAATAYASVRTWSWFFILALPAGGAALALWLRAEVERPRRQAQDMAGRVAHGDLSTRIDPAAGGGALLDSMQQMNDKLAGMIIKMRSGTESIGSSAADVAVGNRDLAQRFREHAAALEQAAASTGQLSEAVCQNSVQAQQAGALARSVSSAAIEAGQDIGDVADTMASIEAASRRIADITGVIDDFASQSAILALDAAVEAERAGAPGCSFAVAAAEIRSLARRSTAAAREAGDLIDSALRQARAGSARARRAAATMQQVVADARQAGAVTGGIADASAGIATGIGQANAALAAMILNTQHDAGLAERTCAGAASIRDQAGHLSRATAAFSLGRNYALPGPGIHLVSSNPDKLVRLHRDGKARARAVPVMHAVVSNGPAAAKPPGWQRSRGNAVRHDLDWDEF